MRELLQGGFRTVKFCCGLVVTHGDEVCAERIHSSLLHATHGDEV